MYVCILQRLSSALRRAKREKRQGCELQQSARVPSENKMFILRHTHTYLSVAFLMSLSSETAFRERASASRTDFHTEFPP